MSYTCRCCGFHSDEICCRIEIDGFDERDRAIEIQHFRCEYCGSEDLDWQEEEDDDLFDDWPEYHDEAMEKYRLNHSEWEEWEPEYDYGGNDDAD